MKLLQCLPKSIADSLTEVLREQTVNLLAISLELEGYITLV